jgi:squalene synthase HpnC
VGHYENFPVASWLCPAPLRPAVVALYWFARTADDLADEGTASTEERLEALAAYRAELARCTQGATPARWPEVFGPLGSALRQHSLPVALFHDLLSAFEQDVRHTAEGHVYADMPELLAYCRLSANPVGRLLLHLFGQTDAASLAQSDAVCSALQLINFWQDLSVDIPRGRYYVPAIAGNAKRPSAAEVKALCEHARHLMQQGAPLCRRTPGRFGWELRLVVQGGLRILDKIQAIDHASLDQRVRLTKVDALVMAWRACWM